MRLIHTMLNSFDYRNQIKKKLIYSYTLIPIPALDSGLFVLQ